MGCFLGCFGASKDNKKRHKISHNINVSSNHIPNVVKNQYNVTRQNVVAAQKDCVEKSNNFPVPEPRVKIEEKQLNLTYQGKHETEVSLGIKKRVTFNSNVKEYEHVSISEAPEIVQENEKGAEEGTDAGCLRPSKSSTVSVSGSSSSSLGSFPPNHRYQNCRESDDEDEDLDCAVSDSDEDGLSEDDEEVYDAEYSDDEYYSREVPEFSTRSCSSMESGTKNMMTPVVPERYNDEGKDQGFLDEEKSTPPGFFGGARDRAGYVNSVLNPIENTAQWKNAKSKHTPPLKQPKDKFQMGLGTKQPSLTSKPKVDEAENNREVAVDASLSTWLSSSQKPPRTKASSIGLEPISSGASASSHGSNSVRSREERPILGALTMEELRQFSASSQRRSPSRSPNEKPLLGTVGVHWDNRMDRTPVEDSGSASSFKGIPNTTSKYREDKSVTWHTTPFETRLERALNRNATDSST